MNVIFKVVVSRNRHSVKGFYCGPPWNWGWFPKILNPKLMLSMENTMVAMVITVKPVLRDHCHYRPPVLNDHTFLAEGPTFQYN